MHSSLTAIRAELAADKAARNMGRGRGSVPVHHPQNDGLAKSRLMGRLVGREADYKDDGNMGDMTYCRRKWGLIKARKSLIFTLRSQTQMINFGQLLFLTPYLLIGPFNFRICTEDLAYSK